MMQALRKIRHEPNFKAARIIALPMEAGDGHEEWKRHSKTSIPAPAEANAPLTALYRYIPFLGVAANSLLAILLILGWLWQQRSQIQAPPAQTHPALPAALHSKKGTGKPVDAERGGPWQNMGPLGWNGPWMRYSTRLSFDRPTWLSRQLLAGGKWRQYSWKLEPHPIPQGLQKSKPAGIPTSWRLPVLDPHLSAIPGKAAQTPPAAPSPDKQAGTPRRSPPHAATPPQPVRMRITPAATDQGAPLTSRAALPRPDKMRKTLSPLSPADQAAMAYREALASYRQGRTLDAEAALWLALELDPGHIEARTLAVHLMMKQGRLGKAHELLSAGIEAVPQHYPFAQSLARILASQGHIQAALSRMEQASASAVQDPEYLALLAWLYQRGNRHAEAAKSYMDALALNPEQGKWWLGLAISLEAKRDRTEALEAYEYALAMGLDTGLRQFAMQQRQRLARP